MICINRGQSTRIGPKTFMSRKFDSYLTIQPHMWPKEQYRKIKIKVLPHDTMIV